eukprot:Blabericola_migrator_1__8405@NODE_437_length_8486_cov_74_294215_g343_i0_p2_GENE_NODE_437_length_8486_cov_74_294215_g343_i0NODE_437_length_8486_cov_74_294215_g343_i0_p2_ORF_typecomplete_len638_score155_22Dus/PF01207_17/7_6e73Torus/PF16131_5/0_0019zfCCCH_4/PF18044_1/0_0085zfCCCH_4/PF18044_1/3_7e03zfCCCH/PF00642_24/0_011zfCCCH/PF00642_24/1_1e04zfCCCH/PF00642_24/4_7e03zfCCCH_3/PF15663_5/0_23SUZ/PF12752_7/0_24zf_CCCH_4/PF18345_1/0_45zfCCCH_2/PF14608_6/0_17zfCCCH_2/PF14608_6/3_1e02zfCCCH_2/PF14608_6/1
MEGFDSDKYVGACQGRSEVPVKPGFLVDKENYKPFILAANGSIPPAEPPSKPEETRQPERLRGQNKKRKLNTLAAASERAKSLCHTFASGLGCFRGDKCIFSHDLKGLREKLESEDLGRRALLQELYGPQCTWVQRGLPCPSGINCCVDPLGHTGTDGQNLHPADQSVVTPEALQAAKRSHYSNLVNEIVAGMKQRGLHRRPPKYKMPGTEDKVKNPLTEDHDDDTETETELGDTQGDVEAADTLGGADTPMKREPLGCVIEKERLSVEEKREAYNKMVKGKTILAPLTTVGNLPFRRLCVSLGCEVTVSEMILASSFACMKSCDLALTRRHSSEKCYGVQIAGGYPDQMLRAAEIVDQLIDCDFVDINAGCPLEGLQKRGAGCAMLNKETRTLEIVKAMTGALSTLPLTFKTRTAFVHKTEPMIHTLIPRLIDAGVSGLTLHGRTAKQRYLREADWDYIGTVADLIDHKISFVGNGDLFGSPDEIVRLWDQSKVDAVMIGRGALIKPWIFEEVKTCQLLDPSSSQRLEYLKQFCAYGLDHWGCDSRGVETTRRFLLEQLSFLHRYVPVGLLERVPQKLNQRPPVYVGRDDLETLMGQADVGAWIKISEMLLGKVPEDFVFVPKHKSNAYSTCIEGC